MQTYHATFDGWVASFTFSEEAEKYRGWLGDHCFVKATADAETGLPGNFWRVLALHRKDGWVVIVGDCDDWELEQPFPSEAAATEAVTTLQTLAPLSGVDLGALGYKDWYAWVQAKG